MIFGKGIDFQVYNEELSKQLLNVLNSKEENLLIGICLHYKQLDLKRFNHNSRIYYKEFAKYYRFQLARILKNKLYFSSSITRFYSDYKPNHNVTDYIQKLKKIWDKKDVVIIEGQKTRLGVGNNLFDNMNSIERIICPIKNAFNTIKTIINTIKIKVSINKLILISLGPTATVLAYDLYKLGYRVIDIGHADIEYEWFLRKAKNKMGIINKYVNESPEKFTANTKVMDKNYYRQIIAEILD